MPKVNNTRRHKAARLLLLAATGPEGTYLGEPKTITLERAIELQRDSYRLWSRSWLLPLIRELVPELKEKRDAKT